LRREARAQRRSRREKQVLKGTPRGKRRLKGALKMMIKGSRLHLKGGKARRCSRKGR
jgi:hypothetical protein